jgi:methionyl-tRNA formyltransferase
MARLRIVFMGTPEIAARSLQALLGDSRLHVLAVVSQPDQPKGRGLKLQPTPAKQAATAAGVPVIQPESVRAPEFFQTLRDIDPELIVVTAFGRILPGEILNLPRLGCINVHTSLLPKYRGAAPIQHAILNGEKETGVTIMKMDAGMDTGDILSQLSTPIGPEDDASTLYQRLGDLGATLLLETIAEYSAGRIQPSPQPPENASHAPRILKQDGHIDWNQPATSIWCRVRAMVPWPTATTRLPVGDGSLLLKIWRAERCDMHGTPGRVLAADKSGIVVGCGTGSLRILELQREGGRRMNCADFLSGQRIEPGQPLGQ